MNMDDEGRPIAAPAPTNRPRAKNTRRGTRPRKVPGSTGLQTSILALNGMLDAWRGNLPRREYRRIVEIGALILQREHAALEEAALKDAA